VRSLTFEAAKIAGRVDGEAKGRGVTITVADLLIGCTALEMGFCVVTENVRHFKLIPGLVVKKF
jgi:predicted nucleic acid-binding protein